jgi:glycerophosphoryl diester phosphodiesterase
MENKTIALVAHRGYHPKSVPENSYLSIELAHIAQCATVEIDICLTSDNKFVLSHDLTFEKVNRDPKLIRDMTLEECCKVHLGTHQYVTPLETIFTDYRIAQPLKRGANMYFFIDMKCAKGDEEEYARALNEFFVEERKERVSCFLSDNVRLLEMLDESWNRLLTVGETFWATINTEGELETKLKDLVPSGGLEGVCLPYDEKIIRLNSVLARFNGKIAIYDKKVSGENDLENLYLLKDKKCNVDYFLGDFQETTYCTTCLCIRIEEKQPQDMNNE